LYEELQRNYQITYLEQYDTDSKIKEFQKWFFDNKYPVDLEKLITVTFDKKEEKKKEVFTNQFFEYKRLIDKKNSYAQKL
jgi:hypothetical protein